jgi:hypothetical protein
MKYLIPLLIIIATACYLGKEKQEQPVILDEDPETINWNQSGYIDIIRPRPE